MKHVDLPFSVQRANTTVYLIVTVKVDDADPARPTATIATVTLAGTRWRWGGRLTSADRDLVLARAIAASQSAS